MRRLAQCAMAACLLATPAAAQEAPAAQDAAPTKIEAAPTTIESPVESTRALIRAGKIAEAEAKARGMLEAAEAGPGAESIEAAQALDLLVESLWRGGRTPPDELSRLAERSIHIKEAKLGPEHPDVAHSLILLGRALADEGQFAEARPLLERALAIHEKALGPDHLEVAKSANALGVLLDISGDYPRALALYERALSIREKALGPEHPDVARSLNNLGILHGIMGDYPGARALHERALAIREKALGPDHPEVAVSLDNLALVLKDLGDRAAARPLFERALAIREKTLGPDHPEVAANLSNLASLLQHMGDLDAALPMYERGVAILERALGPDHPRLGLMLNNYATCLRNGGRLTEAQALAERGLAIEEKTLGPEHPEVAMTLANLGMIHMMAGDPRPARPLLGRSLTIRRATLGTWHPDVAVGGRLLAEAQATLGETDAALESSLTAEQVSREHLRATVRSETEAEAIRTSAYRIPGIDVGVRLAARGVLTPADQARVWDAVIRSRALVLDEMAARFQVTLRSGDAEMDSLAAEVERSRGRFANLVLSGPVDGDSAAYAGALLSAEEPKQQAERRLAARSTRFREEQVRAGVGMDEVLESLPAGTALVAYFRYDEEGAWSATPPALPQGGYVAFVARRDRPDVATVALGDGQAIEEAITAWRMRIAGVQQGEDEMTSEAACRRLGEDLRRRIWDPVATRLDGIDRVLVVPDVAMHGVPLGALPWGTNEYLIEHGPLLHVLSTERDVVRDAAPSAGSGMLAVGDPNYENAVGVLADLASSFPVFRGPHSECPSFRDLRFQRLPATKQEVGAIGKKWRKFHREEKVVSLTGREAGEQRVKREAPGKRIVHLATHGFFLGTGCDPGGADPTGSGGWGVWAAADAPAQESPLLLAGLALAGANRRNEPSADGEDGVLTAEEVAALDLHGVEWVVLSACDTGAGQFVYGEGLLGLRRAFETSGARTLVQSLWGVEDEAGRAWMEALYEARLDRGMETAAAMREASLRVLRDRRRAGRSTHPALWGAFVASGDWR